MALPKPNLIYFTIACSSWPQLITCSSNCMDDQLMVQIKSSDFECNDCVTTRSQNIFWSDHDHRDWSHFELNHDSLNTEAHVKCICFSDDQYKEMLFPLVAIYNVYSNLKPQSHFRWYCLHL